MALLRAVGMPCRLHGSAVSKHFQRGAVPALFLKLAPESVMHTWAEVFYGEQWIALEGVITDEAYVQGVKKRCPDRTRDFKAYAISVPDLDALDLDWKGEALFVQNTSVAEDYGVFDSPDAFFKEHKQSWGRLKDFAYRHFGRRIMNRRLAGIRR